MDYCISLFVKEKKEEQLNNFYTKSVSYIAQGVQAIVNGLAQGEAITPYADFISDKPEDTRTAEEIVDDVLDKCGLGG